MISKVKLTNFMRHRSLNLPVSNGLTCIRGGNEQGKSSTLRAINYALFGVKALPGSLEDTVTWGEPVNTLKVELDIAVDGVSYNIKRGKSGAELNADGVRVTGQTEVTNFICSKLKVDPVAATKLMLAGQGEIRGALEAGTKATTELIERLAEFDQLDHLIELMQERLALGSTAALQARLADAEQQLAELGEIEEPDYAVLEAKVAAALAAHQAAQAALEALEGDLSKAQAQVDAARVAQTRYEQAATALEQARKRAAQVVEKLQEAEIAANTYAVGLKDESALLEEIEALEKDADYLKAYQRLQPAIEACQADEHILFNTIDWLRDRVKDLASSMKASQAVINSSEREIALGEAALSTGNCAFCGQDFSHLPLVAEKNAQIQAKIDQHKQSLQAAVEAQTSAEDEKRTLDGILTVSEARFALLDANPDYVGRVGNDLPPKLYWTGPKVKDLQGCVAKLAEAQRDLQSLRSDIADRQAAQTRLQMLKERKAEIDAEVSAAVTQFESAEARPDLAIAETAREMVLAKRRPLQQAASGAQAVHRDAEYELRDAKRSYESAVQRRNTAKGIVTDLRGQIESTEFNNALLKRVRQARPAIADKLWSIVLSAVSSYFSEMRGARSTVTKDSDGFKVDGHPISTLSGSTLDILGLAIRVALIRTFLPTAPFLVLDEPCAAMDQQRTEATLGFVVACGFKQVVVVTHEDTSETVADHMIEL
jgi:DNA repair exonuclease SbcCD ATPase subunit